MATTIAAGSAADAERHLKQPLTSQPQSELRPQAQTQTQTQTQTQQQQQQQHKRIPSTRKTKTRTQAAAAASVVPKRTRKHDLLFALRLGGLIMLSIIIVIILCTAYPILIFHRRRWRTLADNFQALWVNSFLWLLPPTNMHFTNLDELPDGSLRPKVLIANHQCDIDWLYLWAVARMTSSEDRSGKVKIFLKQEVKSIPIVGWGCAFFDFIFLARKWEVDKVRMEKKLKLLADDCLWLVIFPEGSTVNTKYVEKSKVFARQSGRPELEKLLLPRSRGLQHILDTLSEHSPYGEPEIFDLTIAFDSYSGEVPTWEQGFDRTYDKRIPNFQKVMRGTAAENTYIDSRRFCYKQMKSEGIDLEKWLDDRWVRKESLLKHFAETQHFSGHADVSDQQTLTLPVKGSIWRPLMAVSFYICMWGGMIFTYAKYYSSDSESFFDFDGF